MSRSSLAAVVAQHFDDYSLGAGSVLCIVAGAVLLRYGWTLWSLLLPGTLAGAIILVYVVATSLGLLLVGASGVDIREHGRAIAAFVVAVIVSTVVGVFLVGIRVQTPGPDALLFSQYAVDLLLAGENPYAASMAPAWERYGTLPLSVTPTLDGGHVTSFSYPAGSILVFVPQRLLGIPDFGQTVGLAAVGALAYLTYYSPGELALAPATLFLTLNLVYNSFMGVTDALWLLPVLVAMHSWYRGRLRWTAVWMGVACSLKQQPWIITPFLAVWLYHESSTLEAFLDEATQTLAWGVGTFLAINLPFLLWNPAAWVASVFTPVGGSGGTLIHQGVGLTALTVSGQLLLPTSTYVVYVALATVTALLAYAVYWDRLKWVAWVMPAVILFVHYRSLLSYFLFLFPVAYWAALLATDSVYQPGAAPAAVEPGEREEVDHAAA